MASPRPYVAAAAASVLAALYFVPSAQASPNEPAQQQSASVSTSASTSSSSSSSGHGGLADTGAINTKPYLVGGAAFLLAGAGLVVDAGRRARRLA
ncbi:hypothetical protein [Actinacidiphila acididurans]|uniref:Gram-positive cocci surface proteins LPxTG domain-containing protein n=1 Tax=Actinacidiphila acididurans TaxID=2784346 RepID=A0ABS2TMM0_9ACTN|nr:hypothetical protein [Actinacidiphila acididurans]MBM9504587.1 hypothetical protein [Actinacidiphila acididurans]